MARTLRAKALSVRAIGRRIAMRLAVRREAPAIKSHAADRRLREQPASPGGFAGQELAPASAADASPVGKRRDEMPEMDEIAEVNRRAREKHPSQPMLDIDIEGLKACSRGEAERPPHPYRGAINPPSVLRGVEGKNVLCLASGGGQQSAFFGILGAKVTVLDIADSQLEQDRVAAAHYGYPVKTVRGDMRDLSCFEDALFDHVDMGIAIYAVPDVRPVYREIARVLKPGGTCRIEHMNPATMPIEPDSWDGSGYRISVPYGGGRYPPDDPEGYGFRHLFSDMFNGLMEAGLTILEVWESPDHLDPEVHGDPGTHEHLNCIVQCGMAIVAQK